MSRPLVLNKPVIAITGSAGKTTTKEMIASVLKQRLRILKTSGNANAPRHTVKYAQRIQPYHQAVVLEYGMSHPGQIRRHCKTIQPNIGIVTNVGTAHIGNFGGKIQGIANTKSDLIRYMKQTGLLVLNADDNNSKLLDTSKFKGKILYVSQTQPSHYKAEDIKFTNNGMKFKLKLAGQNHEFLIPVFGRHNIYNALFAIAVAYHLGFSINEIKTGLRWYYKPRRRLTVYNLRNGVKIIDDTFSANPNAVRAAIDVLVNLGRGRKIAVLGTMLEMGKYSVKGHKIVGRHVARRKLDYLYTYGRAATIIGKGAREEGFPKQKIKEYLNRDKLVKDLRQQLKPNTTVLFKASHGMGLGKAVDALLNKKKR